MCKTIKENNASVQGWSFKNPKGFHAECVLCKPYNLSTSPINNIVRLPLEIRYKNNVSSNIVTWKGFHVDMIPVKGGKSCLGFDVNYSGKYNMHKEKRSDLFLSPEMKEMLLAVYYGEKSRPKK